MSPCGYDLRYDLSEVRPLVIYVKNELPVRLVEIQLAKAIRKNSICIIAGETGSGKSTQIPQICIENDLAGSGNIVITQPRRIAAITIAECVAQEMNCSPGELVGYKIRFENVTNEETRIIYGTDGIFLREAFYDSLLSQYSIIIVDEAHERSIHTDILLFILKLIHNQRKNTKNPLKLIIMSATLDTDLLSDYFDQAPVFLIEGRRYPIELFYACSLKESRDDYVFNCLATLMQVHQSEPTDSGVLVFLTGQEEIEAACKQVYEISDRLDKKILVLPLYANLSPSAQMRDVRKVVFSTNIAETSVTIPGIKIVIDSGKVKIRTFLPDRRIDVLRVEDVCRASATQRAGRAGREAPGKCYRLYSEKDFQAFEATAIPEILRSNLSSVLLELLRIGLRKIRSLSLPSSPSIDAIKSAQYQLRMLDALQPVDHKGRIFLTDLGNKLSAFPIDPPLARVLIAASQQNCLEEALTIVSFMAAESIYITSSSDRDASNNSRKKYEAIEGDHITLLNIYRAYRFEKYDKKEWCITNFVNERVMNIVIKIRRQLREICQKNEMNFVSCGTDRTKLRKALCTGLFMNSCEYDRSSDSYRLVLSPETIVKIHPSSCLAHSRPTTFIYSDLVKTCELYARDITVVDSEWIKEIIEKKKHLLVFP
ncbi:unnamed protein product [Dracunculus medinensis]|uniref:RNA helicase n=1 Tax=Dracunculus medinensis TaxID=318479 RepID=A0A158Q5I0_DRAME|nr:unnamed protein product [Dracunculus medinensis]